MGAVSMGPADLLMLKLVSSKRAIPSVLKADPMKMGRSEPHIIPQEDGALGIVFSAVLALQSWESFYRQRRADGYRLGGTCELQ
jgi:hypothetical protein